MLHHPSGKRCIEKAILKNTSHAAVMGGYPLSFVVALYSAALVLFRQTILLMHLSILTVLNNPYYLSNQFFFFFLMVFPT